MNWHGTGAFGRIAQGGSNGKKTQQNTEQEKKILTKITGFYI